MKVLTVVGARPQFIKAAVVSRAFAESGMVREIIVHTGQHYDENMSEIFFSEMAIPAPDYHLGIGGASHGAMTGRMLESIEGVVLKEKPDVVLVYGDTNSTLAGALAAAKCHIPVAHVEAGLRSYNTAMPEEINRVLTDQLARWLFCPTETAVANLQNEGLPGRFGGNPEKEPLVLNVGDVMYDAVLFYKKIAVPSRKIKDILERYNAGFYLATLHRAENTDVEERLGGIIAAFENIAATTPVVLPLHPRTRKTLERMGLHSKNITQLDPVGYFDILQLLANCQGVLTDSGGLQKEAYFVGKRCAVLRDETEWVELVESGWNILTGANQGLILEAARQITQYRNLSTFSFYGDGDAGGKICGALIKSF